MLIIHIPAVETFWLEDEERFITTKEYELSLEHSLISISKWESKWKLPFLSASKSKNKLTNEQLIDYIRCMTITQNVDPDAYYVIPDDEIQRIQEYIDDDHTATFFREPPKSAGRGRAKDKIITSEVLYYYMICLEIPMECQKWHLGRLMTLIKVCNELNKEADPKNRNKKLTSKEQMNLAAEYDRINEQRKKELGTKG